MAAQTVPNGFTDLATALQQPKGTFVDVIGVVNDVLPSRPTVTSESVITFKLMDKRLRDSIYGSGGLKVRIFSKKQENQPQIKHIGDVILIRRIKVWEFSGETLLLASFDTRFLVFSGTTLPSPNFKFDYVSGNNQLPAQGSGVRTSLTPADQDYIITLKSELNIRVQALAPADVPAPGTQRATTTGTLGHKFKHLKDLRDHVFSDLCVQVVKKFPGSYGYELYVTDYTENKAMFYYAAPGENDNQALVRDGDQFGYNGPPKRDWPGPYGFMVFKVTLVPPHSTWVDQNVFEGDTILMENVKIKAKDNGRLEGDMWPDHHNHDRVLVRKLHRNKKEVSDLLMRKNDYWEKRSLAAKKEGATEPTAQGKLTKGQKKRLRAQKVEERAQRDEVRVQGKREKKKAKAAEAAALAEKEIESNRHVRCTHIAEPLTTIARVLNTDASLPMRTLSNGSTYRLPYTNSNYHVKARVVDFDPPSLADFATQKDSDESDDDKSEYSVDMTWRSSTPKWEWSFSLELEQVSKASGAGGKDSRRVWVHVGHAEAQHLFGNAVDDPTNLREDAQLLNKLREKLCILWGSLEERKRNEEDEERRSAKRTKIDEEDGQRNPKKAKTNQEDPPAGRPFDCCLSEYGKLREGGAAKNIGDWERQFMMSGVLIN